MVAHSTQVDIVTCMVDSDKDAAGNVVYSCWLVKMNNDGDIVHDKRFGITNNHIRKSDAVFSIMKVVKQSKDIILHFVTLPMLEQGVHCLPSHLTDEKSHHHGEVEGGNVTSIHAKKTFPAKNDTSPIIRIA